MGLVVQQLLVLAQLGPGLRRERGGGLRVPAVLGGKAPAQRDVRGDVGQQAGGPADAGLERLIGRGRGGSLGRVSKRCTASTRPAAAASWAWASSSRGRDRSSSAGSAEIHRWIVAASPRSR